MRKHLITIGSSLGLIIDKPILDLLRITPETELEMETDGNALTLRPIRVATHRKAMRTYRRVAQQHRRSLRKLAK
jgi:antitoxin MazE